MLIGGHVSSAGGLVQALERAEELGCEAMQIFNQSPRAWRPTNYTAAAFAEFREQFRDSSVQAVFIHAVYLINCASDDAEVRRKSGISLTHALTVGDAIGAAGVIVHPGSGRGAERERTMQLIGDAFERALGETEASPLLLENTAGAGFTVGRHFDELAEAIERSGGGPRLGVCLDSCHLLASGYEVREPHALAAVIDDYERTVGLDRLQCLHLNDSKMPLGSNRDRHADLGEGKLGVEGVRVFLSEPRFQGMPVLLEVPGPTGHGPDIKQIALAKRLRDEATKKQRAARGAKRSAAGRGRAGRKRERRPAPRR
jgi:deoxyribonuclease IV